MRWMRLVCLAVVFALVAALFAARHDAESPAVNLEVISYDDLGERVVALQGRVVVVDFWADYCLPCKKEFPKLVALHRKHAADGLTAISVSLDDAEDDEVRERVRRFLTVQQAAFANFLLAEKPSAWQAKLKIDGPPCLFLFDRQGRLVKKYHDHVDYDEVERLVIGLLK